MATKKFTVDILSKSSVDKLKKELEAYRNDLPRKCQLIAQRLAELGVEYAKANVVNLDAVFTAELYRSIHSEQIEVTKEKAVFAVVANSDHAVFVEFGTGIVGKESPYPYPFPQDVSWQYASGKTIRQLADGRYGWFYERDGQWYFTEGMPSRPFMYMAGQDLMKQVTQIVKEVFA